MAKKKKELTPEERLNAALVPEEEWPYELPDGWKWVRLEGVAEILMGQSPKGTETTDDDYYTPLIGGAADMGTLYPNPHKFTKQNTKLSQDGDLILCIRATLGRPVLSDGVYCLGRGVAGIRPINANVNWLKYFFVHAERYLYENATGSTFLQVTGKVLQNMPTPLPPLEEQQRIVTRIESLFAKLDEAQEKVQHVIDGFETRKAALLHEAFTGKLTVKWRKENNSESENWQIKSFSQVAEVASNLVDPFDYLDYPHIAPDNIEKFTGRLLKYHTIREDKVKSPKHLFSSGQILYSKIRPYLSKVIIVDFDGLCSADMYPINPKENMNARFLWYYMLSNEFLLQASNAGSRSVLPKINQKELAKIKVPTTSKEEQHEIVRILDSLFAKEEKAKSLAEMTLASITQMKQSILARAFRGEL